MEKVIIGNDEQALVIQAVETFARQEIEPHFTHPENKVCNSVLCQITNSALDMGILSKQDNTGLGLWEAADDAKGFLLSTDTIIRLAQSNAGIAFDLHTMALGKFLARRLDLDTNDIIIPFLQGRSSLPSGVLANFLQGEQIGSDDMNLLETYFPSTTHSTSKHLLQAGHSWNSILLPFFDKSKASIQWRLVNRDDVNLVPVENNHGLDETTIWQVDFPENMHSLPLADVSADQSLKVLIEGMGMNAIALIAIGLGTVKKAYLKARQYAKERIQGGKPIHQHAAIQLKFGEIASIIETVETLLEAQQLIPTDLMGLNGILKKRMIAHPLLCKAATEALQVFGGYGYMQDFGMEKILRDNQHLKLSFGTPQDLKLFLGAQEI
ncbi:MAG: hypothetical protein GY751_13510 [Bacteroidetes bacterium]|nr:hypothetical protein [Bacteroidota bacterium]